MVEKVPPKGVKSEESKGSSISELTKVEPPKGAELVEKVPPKGLLRRESPKLKLEREELSKGFELEKKSWVGFSEMKIFLNGDAFSISVVFETSSTTISPKESSSNEVSLISSPTWFAPNPPPPKPPPPNPPPKPPPPNPPPPNPPNGFKWFPYWNLKIKKKSYLKKKIK